MSSPVSSRCPACGAAVSPDDVTCAYCRASLTSIACPECFAPVARGAKYCPSCGSRTTREQIGDYGTYACPRCQAAFTRVEVGGVPLLECNGCGGAWMHPEPFERVCAHNEAQAAVLACPSVDARTAPGAEKVSYLGCPECSKLMNRVNFAKCSGVIMDVCKDHGTFFDRDELRRIVTFIREGGLEMAREHEREKLVLEQQRLARMRMELERERFAAQPVYHESGLNRSVLTDLISDLFGG